MPADDDKTPPSHWRDIHKRKNTGLLYAEDLGPAGTAVDAWINETGTITVEGADGKKLMPYIAKRGRKKLGLNATNCKTLETITGSADRVHWVGWFTLVVVRTSYQDMKTKARLTTDAIRIAPERPKHPPPAGEQLPTDRGAPAPPSISAEEQAEIDRIEREDRR